MAFQIQIAGAEELSSRHLLTEVVISRPLYDHSRAELTLHWHEGSRYEDRQTAFLAGKLLDCPIEIQWKDNDLAEHFNGFRGYVESTRGSRNASSSSLVLSCVSFTKRTDLIPRYRTFQATTLLEIAQHVAKSDPLIKIDQAGDLDVPITLSVQHGETDFAYPSRMLHAWGVPMALRDRTGQVILGARGTEPATTFPDVCFGWTEVNFSGALQALPYLAGGGGGPAGVVAGREQAHNSELSRLAAKYYSIPDAPAINKRVSEAASRVDTSGYHLILEGAVLPFSPGDVVTFEGQQHLIRDVLVTGHAQQTTATQEFRLQPLTLPLPPDRPRPQWTSRALWAHVTANEHDPLHQGRIQVEFEWEHMDPQPSAARAWLHTLTPYGGGSGGAKSTGYTGFYSVPEVGERVLVEFLGEWDSEAVVIGGIREGGVPDAHNQKRTKRWRTPEGNAIAMHSHGPLSNVRLETKNKIMLATEVGEKTQLGDADQRQPRQGRAAHGAAGRLQPALPELQQRRPRRRGWPGPHRQRPHHHQRQERPPVPCQDHQLYRRRGLPGPGGPPGRRLLQGRHDPVFGGQSRSGRQRESGRRIERRDPDHRPDHAGQGARRPERGWRHREHQYRCAPGPSGPESPGHPETAGPAAAADLPHAVFLGTGP